MQSPPEASGNRTREVIQSVETIFASEEAVDRVVAIQGFSFSGAGDNAALAFVSFKDWSERGEENSADAIAGSANGALFQLKDAIAFALSPPPIQGSARRTALPSGCRIAAVSGRRRSLRRRSTHGSCR